MNKERLLHLAAALNTEKMYENGLAVGQAYHDLPFDDLELASWRKDVRGRAELIKAVGGVTGTRGIDLGCSIGGLTFALQLTGAKMTGVDFNKSDIQFAKSVEAEYITGAEFRLADVDSVIWQEMIPGDFRFALWLSQWMWYVRQVGVKRGCEALRQVSLCVECLWFEISIGDGFAGNTMLDLGLRSSADVEELLREWTVYDVVNVFEKDLEGSALRRPLYYCAR